MNNPIESYNQYGELSTKIWNFNDIQSQLKEWWEILLAVKSKHWKDSELYKQFEKEYRDLYQTIKEAFESEKTFSQEERAKIIMELWDVVTLAQNKGVVEKKGTLSKIGDFLRNTDTQNEKEKALSFREKKVQEYTQTEAVSAMEYLSSKYWEYKDVWNDDKLSKWLTFQYSTINQLDDRYEVRLFQDELIKKIFWEGKQFNHQFVLWFNHEKWNFLVKIEDFEKQLQDGSIQVKDINSRALWNYFLYLKSKGKLTPENIMDLFGANKLYELREVWEIKDEWDWKMKVAKQIMQDNGLGDIIKVIELFSSPDNFLAWIQELSKNQNQAHIAFKLFEKNTNSIKQQFKTELKNKFLKANPGKEKEADKIIDEMMVELDKNKSMQSLPQVLKIFHDYNEKYKLGLSISEEAKKLIGVRKQENQLEIIKTVQEEQQAIESKDEKALGKIAKRKQQLTLEKSELDAMGGVVSKTSDIDIKKIISWEVRYEDHVSDLMKKDEVFRETMMRFQQEQNQFYEDYPEEKKTLNHQPEIIEDKPFVEMYTHTNTLSYPDGSFFSYEPLSWGNYKIDGIEMSYTEFHMVKKDKDIYKNIQHFQQTLQELNLEWLWKYRQSLFNAISSKYVGSFEIQNDYMNAREIKIFISSVLSSIGVSLSPDTPTEEFKQKVKYVNKVWILGGQEDINVRGEWFIESKFLDKFDSKRTGIIHPHVLQKEIWNLFWENV